MNANRTRTPVSDGSTVTLTWTVTVSHVFEGEASELPEAIRQALWLDTDGDLDYDAYALCNALESFNGGEETDTDTEIDEAYVQD